MCAGGNGHKSKDNNKWVWRFLHADVSTSTKCGPCSLCQQHSNCYFHPQSWELEKRTLYMSLLMLEEYETIHVCICWACHHDMEQNSGKCGYVPRSIKLRNLKAPSISADAQKCHVTGCSNQADIKSTDSINLDDTPSDIAFSISDPSANLCLCAHHYYRLYRHQH